MADIDLVLGAKDKFWHKVEDGLPEAGDSVRYPVICKAKSGRQSINLAWVDEDGFWHGQGSMAGVTHWANLPEMPDDGD